MRNKNSSIKLANGNLRNLHSIYNRATHNFSRKEPIRNKANHSNQEIKMYIDKGPSRLSIRV